MKNIFEYINMGTAVSTTAILISLVFFVFSLGISALQNNSNTAFSMANGQLKNTESTVMGDSVVYYAESSGFHSIIYTAEHPEGFSDVTNIRNVTSTYYVDPSKEFYSRYIYEDSGIVSTVLFVERNTIPVYQQLNTVSIDRTMKFLNKEVQLYGEKVSHYETLLKNEERDAKIAKNRRGHDIVVEPDAVKKFKQQTLYKWLADTNNQVPDLEVE